MSISVTAIVIVAIVVSGVVRLARIKNGTDLRSRLHRKLEGQPLFDPAQPSPRELELQREVEALRDRVRVLERITVDERHSRELGAEIESLRDR